MPAGTGGQPGGLRSPEAVAARRRMLDAPHMAPLLGLVAALRAGQPGTEVPDFDPLDGGTEADVLLLLEKPGPGAAGRGSGLVSRDNADPTAVAIHRFMREAGLPRGRCVIWNAVPWWNGTCKVTAAEVRAGLDALPDLLERLPRLRSVLLAGRTAGRARPLLEGRGLRLHESVHPSPQVRASRPAEWQAIPLVWSAAG